jgi:hypothetical protein
VEVFDALFQQRHRVGFVNSIPLQISGIARRDRVFEPYASRSRTVPDDQGHAADSGTGQPRRGRASRRRLSGRRDSPTSRTATTEPASVVQCVPAAKKVARSRRAPQRSGPRPDAYPAPSFFVGARCAIAASIVIPFPPREHTVEP